MRRKQIGFQVMHNILDIISLSSASGEHINSRTVILLRGSASKRYSMVSALRRFLALYRCVESNELTGRRDRACSDLNV